MSARAFLGLALAALGACALGGCASPRQQAAGKSADAVLVLAPESPNAASRIAASFADPWMGGARWSYEWKRNGAVIAGASGSVLDPGSFSKDDEIEVIASETAPREGAAKRLSARVRIVNAPPRVTEVILASTTSSGAAEIEATVTCLDPDGEAPALTYRWFQNGEVLAGVEGPRLAMSGVPRGSRIVAEVTARDGAGAAPAVRSGVFELENRPPVISSRPVAVRAGDRVFEYQAVAVDPDGDPLRYELLLGPLGMGMEPSGRLSWLLPEGDRRAGNFAVRLRSADGNGGEAIQDFTIHLEPSPR